MGDCKNSQSNRSSSEPLGWGAMISTFCRGFFWQAQFLLCYLADCPAVSLDLCTYTAGGGNPLYRAELLKQCSSVKNKAIGLIFFAELESYMHKVDVEANK